MTKKGNFQEIAFLCFFTINFQFLLPGLILDVILLYMATKK